MSANCNSLYKEEETILSSIKTMYSLSLLAPKFICLLNGIHLGSGHLVFPVRNGTNL